jgi:hypothetical protein
MDQQKPSTGIDYGAPPRRMLLANMAILELWEKAGCTALGYLQMPGHRAASEPPGVAFMFTNLEKGIEVFELFRSWDTVPGSGQGVDVVFVQNQPARTYQMMLGPNFEETVKRLLGPRGDEDYSIMLAGANIGKNMPDTGGGIGWLRKLAVDQPIMLVPAGPDKMVDLRHAITKHNAQFYDHDALPEHLERMFGQSRDRVAPPPPPDFMPEVTSRRPRQLKRFFAVTMARLEQNAHFCAAVAALGEKYERWECVQAACNLLVLEAWPKVRADNGGPDFVRLYEVLRQNPEDVTSRRPLERDFNATELSAQISHDRKYLALYCSAGDQEGLAPGAGTKGHR